MDNLAEAKFTTGALRHTVLAGVDLSYLTYKEAEGFETDDIAYVGDNPVSIDIGSQVPPLINFNYGASPIMDPPVIARTKQDLLSTGVYLQDQIKLDRWILTLGARHDWLETKTTWDDLSGSLVTQDKRNQSWSGRAALGYLFDWGFAPYIAYATSFSPTAGTAPPDADTQAAFDPSTAESKEVGFKYAPPGLNLLIAGSLFDIDQKNGLVSETFERNGVQLSRLVQTGELRSRGGEIEAAASFDNGWSLLASYSYIDMEIVDGGDPANNGNTLSSIPHQTVSLWADYTFKYGVAAGFGIGGGVRYIGSSYGNDENTFKNEARTLFDAAAHYDLVNWNRSLKGARLQLNVSNIFDTEKDICQSDYCYRDKGRTVLGRRRYRWCGAGVHHRDAPRRPDALHDAIRIDFAAAAIAPGGLVRSRAARKLRPWLSPCGL
jgi:iron complex outermembrane receptor protein